MNASSTMSVDLQAAALNYAAKGLPVFPCDENKQPLVKEGFQSASKDPETVRGWWARWPEAMIGMPTGAATGFWALDIDDPEQFESSCRFDMPATRRVDTGKGYHLYFKYDPAAPMRNHQRHPKRGWPFSELPGAETRGDGGYVIVPPSLHPSGRRYAWHDGSTVVEAPAELLAVILRGSSRDQKPSSEFKTDGADTRYGLAALDRECAAVRSAGNGEQECALNEAALKIGALVAGGELTIGTAQSSLIAAGLAMPSYNPRDAWTPEKIVAKVGRGLADGAANPRSAPDRDEPTGFREAGDPGPQHDHYDHDTGECFDEPEPDADEWPSLDLTACAAKRAPAREWLVDGWVPANKATLLAGDGGMGKSLLAQIQATCVAFGRPFLGVETRQANAAYLSWEDDAEELWRRQESICEAMAIPMASLAGRLHLVSYTLEANPFLVTAGDTGVSVTPLGRKLERLVERHYIGLLILDNASQTAGIDHNAVDQVAPFAHWLGTLATQRNGAVVLLHHTNKAGQDYLGSVAYNNQFRSRMLLARPEECADPDVRELTNPKANYSRAGNRIEVRWFAGAFIRDEDLEPSAAAQLRELSAANAQCEAFLRCLRQRASEGVERAVGPSSGPNYAPSQFEGMPEAKGVKKAALKGAMDRLFRMGRIAVQTVERPGKSGTKNIIVEVPDGFPNASPNAPRTHFPNAPEHRPEHPREHTTSTTYYSGAATRAAAPSMEGEADD
ncbi:bifunctional DNA primase/polymerase [Novosphingobium sp. 9U]|uniref:bifunctional DNA primase/polymerase n=1 Tax=Novosphingobium sp. 9U TaxID=2653158 RepID=UPI0012EFB886|nr:bifunctional DNA primase/polymerase [Novosphingobium sp. 9U]VWX52970.1 hypothetical protein NOVOSPHI9U_420213 [Novosphingobium sp. 9U]